MRSPLLAKNRLRLRVTKDTSLPPPIGGWNAKDVYTDMKPTDAVILKNWFPGTSAVFSRGGYASHATGVTGKTKTLATYSAMTGTETLFAVTTSGIYDVTSAGAVGASKLARTDGKHQWINYGDGTNNWLILVNGVDKPAYFDGTTWTAVDSGTTPAITGVTSTNLIGVMAYQGRVIFIQKNSLKFWYLPSGVVGGAALSFDLSGECQRGGYLIACLNWTYDGGAGSDDRAVFVTSMGEVLVYQGNNPSSSTTWAKVGTYYFAKPIGRRCLAKYGGDVLMLTQDGIFGLSDALTGVVNQSKFNISSKIDQAFGDRSYSYGTIWGWEIINYPQEGALIVNIPQTEDGIHVQYVMNTLTNAWCEFSGWSFETFGILNNQLYGAITVATDSVVYKAWTGTTDAGGNIICTGQPAFSKFGYSGLKKIKMYRPTINSSGTATTSSLSIFTDISQGSGTGVSTLSIVSGFNDGWESPPSSPGTWISSYLYCATNYQTEWLSNDWIWENGGPI